MFFVGEPSVQARRLVQITHECMIKGIEMVRRGTRLGDIGHAIQTVAERNRFSVVRDFCGHGIGQVFHSAPSVVHYGEPKTGPILEPGMFFTIEPMINAGKAGVKFWTDGWTVTTVDNKPSAHFEHTVLITDDGAEILTTS